MKLIYFIIIIFSYININASLYKVDNFYSYDIFKNYEKIGLENQKIEAQNFFIITTNLKIKLNTLAHDFLYEVGYLDSNCKNILFSKLKIEKKNDIYYKFQNKITFKDSDNAQYIKLPKNTYIFEPLVVSTLLPILKDRGNNKKDYKINLFIPSRNKIVKATLKYENIESKKIDKLYFSLEKYNLYYDKESFEIFADKAKRIVFVDWSSLGYHSIIKDTKIVSFTKAINHLNYVLKVQKIKINNYNVTLYKYISKSKKKMKKILIIDGVLIPKMINDSGDTLSENIFFDKLMDSLSKKGYSFIRYSFENFSDKNLKTFTFEEKYKIIKKIFTLNNKYNTILTLGWGNILSLKLLNDFKNKIKKIIFLNPIYFNYLTILKSQTELEFFTKKEQDILKETLKFLVKKVYSKDIIVFNSQIINTNYFKELFKEDISRYFDILKKDIKISIFTSNYDSDINSKNGWILYSKIKNNNITHKEFMGLNHYFYKIPYKSFAFSYNKNLKIDREFLKYLSRSLRK
jgi:hypothetical protein